MKIYTTTQAAQALGVSRRRVQQMTTAPCPVCGGDGCKRCRQTGYYLPWQSGGRSGGGEVKLIPHWALELPDVQQRVIGHPPGMPNVALGRLGDSHYRVTATLPGVAVGEVVRKSRHDWGWRRDDSEGAGCATREEAIKTLLLSD